MSHPSNFAFKIGRLGRAALAVTITALIVMISGPASAEDKGPAVITLDTKLESMQKAGVEPVIFPHGQHQEKLECAVCHPSIFKKERGANDMSMRKNMMGESCGSANCHNSPTTFSLLECEKCHVKK